MAARLVQAGMLVGGAVGAAVTIRGCAKATLAPRSDASTAAGRRWAPR